MRRWQFRESLILSIIFHIILVMSTIVLPKLFTPPKVEIVEIDFSTPKPPPPPVQPEKLKIPDATKQIVEQDEKPINDEVPDDVKFLSAHNQVVKKQTVAKDLGEFKNMKDKSGAAGDGGSPEKLKQMDLKPKMDFTKLLDKKVQKERELEKSMEEDAIKIQAQKDAAMEAATQKQGRGGSQASQTQDYLKDVDQGMETLLSTREFMYYSFFARIRRQLNQHWGGKVKEKVSKIFKEGRSIASADDKVTKLLITLNKNGELIRVQVLNDSGVRDLDEAAIEAFKEAAPFPNPPSGIVDPDGTVKIRWDFILEA